MSKCCPESGKRHEIRIQSNPVDPFLLRRCVRMTSVLLPPLPLKNIPCLTLIALQESLITTRYTEREFGTGPMDRCTPDWPNMASGRARAST